MPIRNMAEVGARLEKAAMAILGENASASQRYDTYEMLAIQMLDSEFQDYSDGQLEEYLAAYLADLKK